MSWGGRQRVEPLSRCDSNISESNTFTMRESLLIRVTPKCVRVEVTPASGPCKPCASNRPKRMLPFGDSMRAPKTIFRVCRLFRINN